MPADDRGLVYESEDCEIDLARRELRKRGSAVSLGSRAFDVVEALVRSAGQLVTKDELMERVWAGAIIEENTLQVHISAVRKALGPLGGMLKTESGRGYRLLGDWSVRRDPITRSAASSALASPALSSPALASPVPANPMSRPRPPEPARSNIPLSAGSLVGRSAAAQRLRDLLSAYRAVTLTGPGGIGKTALALDLARDLLPAFDDGVWFVEFASLLDGALVPSSVAAAIGLSLAGDAISADAVARWIADKNILLVFDNCEHLIDAIAEMTETILRGCPRATVLATSREVLRIEGEFVYRVAPLEVPSERSGPGDLLTRSAVELFVARIAAVDGGFTPDGDSLAAIGSICRHLDGIPLAIEFAASRAATLGVQYVAKGLGDRFALLTGGRRTALPRHQTLRAALDWSYELLAPAEQSLLRRLAVFAGGFTLEAAAAIARDVAFAKTLEETIADLVAKSLVSFDVSAASGRWRLLETIRAYAHGKLAENGELVATARRHAEYHSDLFGRARSAWERQPTAAWLGEYGDRLDDLRTTLDWAFSADGDEALGLNLTIDAVPLWLQFSLMAECRRRVEQARSRIAAETPENARLRMRLWTALGLSRMYTGEPLSVIETAWNAALELAKELDDLDYQRRAIWGLFASSFNRGQYRAALEFAEWFAQIAADPSDRLIGERLIGTALHILGDQKDARQHIEHMLAAYRPPVTSAHLIRFQNDQVIAARRVLAPTLWLQGCPDQAMAMAEEATTDALSVGHALTLCNFLAQAGCPLALLAGDYDAARRFTATLIEYATRHSLNVWLAYGWGYEGSLLIADGDLENGLRRLREGGEALRAAGFFQNYTPYLGTLAQALGAAGEVMGGLAAVDEALDRVERTEEHWCLAELMRVKGELLRLQGDETAAETCFRDSLLIAKEQETPAWELRTATSLVRLLAAQGRGGEARGLLSPVYERFTEGFATADLRAAHALLDTLPPAASA